MGSKVVLPKRKVESFDISNAITARFADAESLEWVLDSSDWVFDVEDEEVPIDAILLFRVVSSLVALHKDKLLELSQLFDAFCEGRKDESTGTL